MYGDTNLFPWATHDALYIVIIFCASTNIHTNTNVFLIALPDYNGYHIGMSLATSTRV